MFVVDIALSQTYTFVEDGGHLKTTPESNIQFDIQPHSTKVKVGKNGYLQIGGKGTNRFQHVSLLDSLVEPIREVSVTCDRSLAANVSVQLYLDGNPIGQPQLVPYGSGKLLFTLPSLSLGVLKLEFTLVNKSFSDKKNYQLGISNLSLSTTVDGMTHPEVMLKHRIYSVRGHLVPTEHLSPGLYIINGRKILVR